MRKKTIAVGLLLVLALWCSGCRKTADVKEHNTVVITETKESSGIETKNNAAEAETNADPVSEQTAVTEEKDVAAVTETATGSHDSEEWKETIATDEAFEEIAEAPLDENVESQYDGESAVQENEYGVFKNETESFE